MRPSYFAMLYLQQKGYRMIPVNPRYAGQEILGETVVASLDDLPAAPDMVQIFRKSEEAPAVVDEAIRAGAKVIWLQLGIRSDEAAARARAAGLDVVMDRCPKIEYGRLFGEIGWAGVNRRVISAKKGQALQLSHKKGGLVRRPGPRRNAATDVAAARHWPDHAQPRCLTHSRWSSAANVRGIRRLRPAIPSPPRRRVHRELPALARGVVAQDVGGAIGAQHLEIAMVDAEPAVEHLEELDRAAFEAEPARRLLAAVPGIALDLHEHPVRPFSRSVPFQLRSLDIPITFRLSGGAASLAHRRPTGAAMSTTKHGLTMPAGVEVLGPLAEGYDEILSPDALAFLAELERRFGPTRHELLARRREVDARLQAGELPDFLEETREVREADWQIAPVPRDLLDRRVEITGPVDRKMIVNALNCGASVYMADFEDATTPTWANLIEGQINLRDAIRRKIDFTDPDSRKRYRLGDKVATLLVRPRGWHLPEAHLAIDGQPMSGALFDFGLYVFHNAKELIARGTGPVFLPAEAREPS